MSDHDPERDPRTYHRYLDDDRRGRGLTLIAGILVAIAIAAGVMFFVSPSNDRAEQAQLPAATTPAR